MRLRKLRNALVLGILALTTPLAAAAADVDTTVHFTLDKWYDLNVSEGPITLHRIRIAKVDGPVTKSVFVRPGNSEFLQTIQIQLEYSNDSTADWEARIDLALLDSSGAEIDGYNDDEGLGDGERHEEATVMLSTLKYGLERAKKMRLRISCERD
jgi:hypothetical protein